MASQVCNRASLTHLVALGTQLPPQVLTPPSVTHTSGHVVVRNVPVTSQISSVVSSLHVIVPGVQPPLDPLDPALLLDAV